MSQNSTVPAKTPEEIEEFLELPDIAFKLTNTSQAYKTNLLIHDTDFKALQVYLSNLLSFVKYFFTLIDLSGIVSQVLAALATGKTVIPVAHTLNIGSFALTTIGTQIYKCQRIDAYVLAITNTTTPAWVVDQLIVQVKQSDGTVVNPVIKTINSIVTVTFADAIATNYNIILL
jgi:hypothetical protein